MPNSTTIPTDRPTDLTTFTIKMDGEAVPRAIQVLSVVICHEVNRIPSARIVLSDGDPAAAGLYWQLALATRGSFLTPSRDWP